MTFMISGKHEHYVRLLYEVSKRNAVCCSADYIFVNDGSVHVYSWTGLDIQTLSPQLLGVKGRINAIQCTHDGNILQLASGDTNDVCSLHAYKVSCSFLVRAQS